MQNVRLAQRGIAGPLGIFDGPGGLEGNLGSRLESSGRREDLDGILACSIKKYTAAFYARYRRSRRWQLVVAARTRH